MKHENHTGAQEQHAEHSLPGSNQAGKGPGASEENDQKAREVSDNEGVTKGFVQDIKGLAIKNEDFRRVLYTARHCQLVVMALEPRQQIGVEVYTLDQFFRVEEGSGEAVLDGVTTAIRPGFAVVVPAGAQHNIINTGHVPLKLSTLHALPETAANAVEA